MELPEEILAVLPEDPFAQLDLAKKITSIALSSRLTTLELEITSLRRELDEVNNLVADMSCHLTRSEKEKESLKAENAVLTNTVRKLSRDVSKLDVFRKTLAKSLQGETRGVEESSMSSSTPRPEANTTSDDNNSTASTESAALNHGMMHGSVRKTSSSSRGGDWTPKLTPQRSSFTESRSTSGMASPLLSAFRRSSSMPQIEKNRVDGKEFFRQVRTRLSPDQFSSFLSNVKDMNAGKQSREETLRRAVGIFGPDNLDLCAIFQGLITR